MISKEKFVKIIGQLKEEDDFWTEQNNLYRKYRNILLDGVAPIPLISDTIIDLLEENLGLSTDRLGSLISWWIYDAEFGQKEEYITSISYEDENGNEIPSPIIPRTAADLYDLALWEKEFFKDREDY